MITCLPRGASLPLTELRSKCFLVKFSSGSTKLFLKSKHPAFWGYFTPWKQEIREGLEPSEGLKAFLRRCI